MDAISVVVISELIQLPLKINRVPEERAIQILSPDRPDQPFDDGWETGAYGTDLTSLISSTRRLASHRWNLKSGS